MQYVRRQVSIGACGLLWLIASIPCEAQWEPGAGQWALEAAAVSASISHARVLDARTALGMAVGGGSQLGATLGRGQLTAGRDGAPAMFAELVHGSVFLRRQVGERTVVEPAFRASWNYHWQTEFETRFYGFAFALFRQFDRFEAGARAQVGRLSEEAGRTEYNLGLVPLILRWPSR